MTDDHTKQATGCYGSIINETPNIDRLADGGMLFTRGFVTNSICAPSRAVALTGKYSHINGLRDNQDTFDGSQITFPQLLQDAGYQTALIGKWHLKTKPTGFDYWKILPGQGAYYNPTFIEMDDTVKHEGYVTNLITDFAISKLRDFEDDKPFCLLYWHKAPHRNWMPDVKHLDLYDDTDIPIPETFFDDYDTRSAAAREQDMEVNNMFTSFDLKLTPQEGDPLGSGGKQGFDGHKAWKRIYNSLTVEQREAWDAAYGPKNEAFRNLNLTGEELAKWKYQRYIKDYLRCVASVDDNIGRLMDYLDENGLAENTIVIYTSDQGFYLGEHGWYDKRFMYEESFSIPLVVRYPKEIKAGSVTDMMAVNIDFCPTLLDYAGIGIPEDVQGKSLRPILSGEFPEEWRTSVYYHYFQYPKGWHAVKRHYGIRTDRYKLIHFYNDIDEWELYDLKEDPNEINNVYDSNKYFSAQKELHKELEELRKYYDEEELILN
jgi:arylsulfatase A-like enzyme